MNRADAYAVLSRELHSWQNRPYALLLARVGQPEVQQVVRIGEEDVTLRVAVRWANAKKRTLRIDAVADGPSCFRLERLEESVTVAPPAE